MKLLVAEDEPKIGTYVQQGLSEADFEDAQVNFGKFLLVWDHLFGTFYDSSGRLGSAESGAARWQLSQGV